MSWAFTEEKIASRLKEIEAACVVERAAVGDVRLRLGALPTAEAAAPDLDDADWTVLSPARAWGAEREITAWLRMRVTVPQAWDTSSAVLHVEPQDCEILAFVDGVPRQAFDRRHHDLRLDVGSHVVALEAYTGCYVDGTDPSVVAEAPPEHRLAAVELRRLDEETCGLYRDMRFAYETSQALDRSEVAYSIIVEGLDQATNLLDFRQGAPSASFYRSVRAARRHVREAVYGRLAPDPRRPAIWSVGHAHIDTAWLWRLAHTRHKCAHTFSTVLDLMGRYPDFRFTCSQPQQYAYVKEDHPDIYEGIRRAVADGRWEAVGGMWVEADCNVAGGESLVRQFLYGIRFFAREFGTRSSVVWLPDVFGYSAAFPQIARLAGMKYFMTVKIFWSQFNRPPHHTFRWHGIDGSDVLVHFPPNGDYNAKMTPQQLRDVWSGYAQKKLNDSVLYIFGYGDGGGGPTAEMLENAERSRDLGVGPRVRLATAEAFFADLDARMSADPRLPEWHGELYLEYHRGTYTSQGQVKQANRHSEILLQTAEHAAAQAMLLAAAPYPQEPLARAWETVLLNQFHDILPGSSVREVYEDCAEDYARVRAVGEAAVEGALAALTQRVSASAGRVLVFNPLSWARQDVGRLPAEWGIAGQDVTDLDGAEWTLIPLAGWVPSCGYALTPIGDIGPGETLVAEDRLLENRFFRLRFDEHDEIASVYDRQAEREVLAGPGNALVAFEDRPLYWDAWDVDVFYQDKPYPLRGVAEARVVERGPLRAGIEVRREVADGLGSVIVQRVYLYRDLRRIDFETRVDWREQQTLLKVAFPVAVHSPRATYDIQFGNVERPTHWNTSWDWARFEVCGHKWADLSEGDYGVSLLSDSKYGWDIRRNVMRLTLLKSAVSPDPTADRRIHHFTYALYPHAGGWREAQTVRRACELNVPVRAARMGAISGSGLPPRLELLSLDRENLVIEAVKKAEDDDALIVRLYEAHNQRGRAVLRVGWPVASAACVNLLEEDPVGEPPRLVEGGVEFDYRPYEIKTLKLRLGRSRGSVM